MDKIPLGLYLTNNSVQHSLDLVILAESLGYEQAWTNHHLLGSADPIVLLSSASQRTNSIQLGIGVLPIYHRDIVSTASIFVALNELMPDRINCGLGTWIEGGLNPKGKIRPLNDLREALTTLRKLWQKESISNHGNYVDLTEIEFTHQHLNERTKIPIYLGAVQDKMIKLTGEIADGWIAGFGTSPEYTKRAMSILSNSKRFNAIKRIGIIPTIVDEDTDKAFDLSRKIVAENVLGWVELPKIQFLGVAEDLIEEVRTRLEKKEPIDSIAELIPDNVVKKFVAVGSVSDCQMKFSEMRRNGITCPLILPFGKDVPLMLRSLISFMS